jgi:iron complex transport system ATP-binding protein
VDPVLSIRNVTFQYGSAPVLKGASLEVRSGSFLGLLGPNGSGKTTLLRIAAGLLKPGGGSVAVCGRPAVEMSRAEMARHLALLPQSPTLPLTFIARDLVMMGRTPFLGLLGRESREDLLIVERAMEMARCGDLAERRLEELSGGERQRVLLARALAQEPRVLLMDEPTAHMDMRHQIGVADLVVDLVRDGLAAVGVFHDLNLAACYCDRVAVLHRGTIVVEGPPAEVMREGLLSHVFGVDLCLVDHPRSPVPAVLPPGTATTKPPRTLRD